MKRRVTAIMLTFWMLLASCPIVLPLSAEQPEVWDGSIADSFAGGSGTKDDPYLIETAPQLAFLSQSVNEGKNYKGEYLRLAADIRLNDETVTFDADTGLVTVSDSVNTAYLGTGIAGNNSGKNTRFDTTPSAECGWYDSEFLKTSYTGVLNEWIPIGTVHGNQFAGNFDGAGHRISGVYVNTTKDYGGLFGYTWLSSIRNLILDHSVVMGNNMVGGVVAKGETVTASSYTGFVFGKENVGGVAGIAKSVDGCGGFGAVKGTNRVGGIVGEATEFAVVGCEGAGTVCAYAYVGGVVGKGMDVYKCTYTGDVYGGSRVGGLVGQAETVSWCLFKGTVTGRYMTGGVVGIFSHDANYCHNQGTITGIEDVGGVAGSAAKLNLCYNSGSVSGTKTVGGVAGHVNSEGNRCSNSGSVQGETNVGGIIGSGIMKFGDNRGDVVGETYVGGIAGIGSVCMGNVNMGNVTGKKYVGGLYGKSSGDTQDCYNMGAVVGETYVGGLVGTLQGRDFRRCYNVGSVKGKSNVGALAGIDKSNWLSNCYYMIGCAVDGANTVQNGIGADKEGNVTRDEDNEVYALSESMMREQSSFMYLYFDVGTETALQWKISSEGEYPYPVLAKMHIEDHVFDYKNDTTVYWKIPASCTQAGIGYYSCRYCDLSDLGTYEAEKRDHDKSKSRESDDSYHWYTCTICGEKQECMHHDWDDGTFVRFPDDKNEGEVVYDCSVCRHKMSVKIPKTQSIVQIPEKIDMQTNKSQKISFYYPPVFIAVGIVMGAVGYYAFITVKDIIRKRK